MGSPKKQLISAEQRSIIMSSIRSKNTKPEMSVRRYLHGQGFRYLLHNTKLPGKPDLTLPKYRTAVFIHGCFWHQHGCGKNITPVNNETYWGAKLQRNVTRDADAIKALGRLGWHVIIVWECELKTIVQEATLLRLKNDILNNSLHN